MIIQSLDEDGDKLTVEGNVIHIDEAAKLIYKFLLGAGFTETTVASVLKHNGYGDPLDGDDKE